MAKKEMSCEMCGCSCHRMKGFAMLVVGALFLAQVYWFPSFSIWALIGILIALKGAMKMFMPRGCGCCCR